MRHKSIPGKLRQLRDATPALWRPFLFGWLQRRQKGIVPCLLPLGNKLLYVPLPDFYEAYEFFCEYAQGRKELAAFLKQLRPGDVLYDIGGFHGVYSAASKLKMADAISIQVFEPLKPNCEAIARICALNDFAGVEIVPLAVGEGAEISGNVNSRDGMLRFGDQAAQVETKFQSVSLDQFISRSAAPPSIMKIDVEGYEWAVLRGAQQCLQKYRPRLWLEVHPNFLRGQGKSPEDLLGWLKQIGYSLSFFCDHELPHHEIAFHVWCE
jgi:FkbM family methyltransferase